MTLELLSPFLPRESGGVWPTQRYVREELVLLAGADLTDGGDGPVTHGATVNLISSPFTPASVSEQDQHQAGVSRLIDSRWIRWMLWRTASLIRQACSP